MAAAVSDKLGLAGPRESLGEADRQRGGPDDRQVVQPDKADQATVEARFEDVIAVGTLAWLGVERHPPHVVAGAASALGVFDRAPVQQVAGFEVFRLRAGAAVKLNELRPEEEHDGPGEQSILETGEVDRDLAPLAKEAEQVLVVSAAADGELLAGGRLLEELVEAV